MYLHKAPVESVQTFRVKSYIVTHMVGQKRIWTKRMGQKRIDNKRYRRWNVTGTKQISDRTYRQNKHVGSKSIGTKNGLADKTYRRT